MPVTITLQQIRDEGPCAPGWTKLLTNLGNPPLDTHVSLGDIAASNGAQHALWASRCLPESERRNVVMCVLPAVKRAAEHSTDDSVHACIEAIERWVNGDDSVNLLAAANDAKLSEAELASPAEWAAAAANDLAMAALDGDVAWMDDAPHSAVIAASVKAADDPRAAQAEKDERASQVRDIIAVYPPTRKHEWRL